MKTLPLSFKTLVLMTLMAATALAALVFRPVIRLADLRAKLELQEIVPRQFGEWREVQQPLGQIVNPQQTALLRKYYAQTLSRTYVDVNGTVIMLSIAYGSTQNDGAALHYPEVCYPAQGFQLLATTKAEIHTDLGNIAVKQLLTRLGNRYEPVTYWSTLGDKVVQSGLQTKLAQLDYGFRGLIPDGLIFRVSSINIDAVKGYETQAQFVRALITALPAASRLRLAGLSG